MTDFYLTLPSNSSMDHYPYNNGAHFYTDLPQEIDLTGRQFEVGLAEIQFPNTYSNIENGWLEYKQPDHESSIHHNVPIGMYENVETIITHLNSQLTYVEDHLVRYYAFFQYQPITKKVSVAILQKGATLTLSNELSNILGLDGLILEGESVFEGHSMVDIHKNYSSLYIYCDLVQYRQVGDMQVPLLRIVPTTDKSSDIVYKIFEKPHYQPLSRHIFNTVEISLNTDTGKKPSFGRGNSVVTLHLRPRKYSI